MRRLLTVVAGTAAVAVLAAAGPSWTAPKPLENAVAAQNGRFVLDGRGWGHGRGMSQLGAQGAATLGVGYRQILGTYYPGTALMTGNDDRVLRVHLSEDDDGELQIVATPGLRLAGATLPSLLGGSTVVRWRIRLDGDRARVEGLAGTGWRPLTGPGAATFQGPAGTVRLVLPGGNARDYRGTIRAVAAGGRLQTVNDVPMGAYLRSVVPIESPATWRPAALEAQAVAARTYALFYASRSTRGFADVCDTTNCQVYRGVRALDRAGVVTRTYEAASTDRAVAATGGQWLAHRGVPALTEFSASNGGQSVFGGLPYQPGRPDPWDGVVPSSNHRWAVSIPASRIAATWPRVGKVTRLQVLARDEQGEWGGRVTSIKVLGSRGSIILTGAAFATGVGVKHRWFALRR